MDFMFCGMEKGTSLVEVMPNSEKIECIVLGIVE